MDRGRLSPDSCGESLPDHPDLARFVATLYQRLGGRLFIDPAGVRQTCRPDRARVHREGVPQLADAMPAERFRSPEEWEGAIKLVEYWLNRLSAPDKNYVFTLLAQTIIESDDAFDFRERL